MRNLLFFWIIISLGVGAQQVLAQSFDDTELKSLLEKAQYNKKRGNLEGAIGHALLGLDQAESNRQGDYIYEFRKIIGDIYLRKSDYKKALYSYLSIIVSAKAQNNTNQLATGNLIAAQAFSKMGAYEKASEYYQQSYDSYVKLNSKKGKALALRELGYNYSRSNQLDKSIETFETLYDQSIDGSLYSFIGAAQKQLFLDNIRIEDHRNAVKHGRGYFDRIKSSKDIDEIQNTSTMLAGQYLAIDDSKNAIRYATISQSKNDQNTESLEMLGKAQMANGSFEKAMDAFSAAKDIHERRRSNFGIANNHNLVGEAAINNKDFRQALSTLQKAEKIGVEKNTRESLMLTYKLMVRVYEAKGNEAQAARFKSKYEAVRMQIGDVTDITSKVSTRKENLATSYEQEARVRIAASENKRLGEEQKKLRANQKLKDIEILEQKDKLQTQELHQKQLEAERVKQELFIAEQTHTAETRENELEKLQLDADLQKLSSEERAKALELLEKEKLLLKQQTDLQAQKIEADAQARLLYFIVIGGSFLILGILAFAFIRTYNNGKTIREQNQNLAEQQKTILNRNIQLKKSSEAMLSMNNKLKKTHMNLKVVLKKEQSLKEQYEKANWDLKNTQVHLVQAEKMSSLGLLTAGIAHEINNPINFVSSGVQSLTNNVDELDNFISNYQKVLKLDSFDDIKKYRAVLQEDEPFLNELQDSSTELLKDVRYGIIRITEIVNGLRSFSRHDEAEVKETDINESLDSALLILKNKYKNKVEIIKRLDLKLPEIQCFPGQLNQVFVNLINNAIDAIEGQGEISLVSKELEEEMIEIRIGDTGSGMPDDVKAKIFDPFFTTKEIGKGTGLGLSITHGIIEKHNGTIVVESEMGVGTTFIIRLPKKMELEDSILEEEKLNLG